MSTEKRPNISRFMKTLEKEMRWLTPGLGVKRWIVMILAGITLMAVGIALLLLNIYRTAPETWWLPIISALSLRFLARPLRVIVFGSLGIGLIFWGAWGFNRALLRPFIRPGDHVIDTVTEFRKKERGPKIVAIGGGTGLSSVLRGLKYHTTNLTAIVTVADDGGSSGELRKSIGILPPGDLRNCLAALSRDETLLAQLFQYRFSAGTGLNGHSLGNLLITALAELTGSFEEAIAESGKVLAVQGRVLPSTLHDVKLVADVSIGEHTPSVQIKGESQITGASGEIRRIWLEPDNPLAFPPTIQAILSADLILIGPGSLYTSILPNLLVPDLADALRTSKALKFYICNVATQPGETDGFSSSDHLHTLEKHLSKNFFDLIICNRRGVGTLPDNCNWVLLNNELQEEFVVYEADLIDEEVPWRHDSNKLAQVIIDLYYEKTGPLIFKEEI